MATDQQCLAQLVEMYEVKAHQQNSNSECIVSKIRRTNGWTDVQDLFQYSPSVGPGEK